MKGLGMSGARIKWQAPVPMVNERPAVYADRVGRWYVSQIPTERRKRFGQYLTPVEVADFMAGLCKPAGRVVRVLDPGAGAGVLSCALCETWAAHQDKPIEIELEAYETDAELAGYLASCLSYTEEWLRSRKIRLKFRVDTDDFIIARADALTELPRLFPTAGDSHNNFDLVISNPPYFKISKSDPRARAASAVVHGQPNVYAIFMAISASLLKPNGELVFITPRSYTAGPYFRLFRERFFAVMRPEAIHLFNSRREAFSRDEVLQENVILLARRADDWPVRIKSGTVSVSSSAGVRDLSKSRKRDVALSDVVNFHSRDKILWIPVAERDDDTARMVRAWRGRLHTYGLEVSTGPVVPFRALPFIYKKGYVPETHAPLLWMQNVTPMRVKWPTGVRGKEQYILVNDISAPLLVPNNNIVLLRRFSSKEEQRRLVAAPFLKRKVNSLFVGLENHLNYIHRPGGSLSEEEAYGLAALFNSAMLDTYFRIFNGNTQVNATELRTMPLPPLDLIVEIGKRAMASGIAMGGIDNVIADVLSLSHDRAPTDEQTDV
jgi:adenine-specific DNA-methyltransferase